MKTIKIIDLLNKIVNGKKVPKRIKYKDVIYEYDMGCRQYYRLGSPGQIDMSLRYVLIDFKYLNDEAEIIEDKKIENIYHCCMFSENQETQFLIQNINDLSDKINEIIDVVNKGENNENN